MRKNIEIKTPKSITKSVISQSKNKKKNEVHGKG